MIKVMMVVVMLYTGVEIHQFPSYPVVLFSKKIWKLYLYFQRCRCLSKGIHICARVQSRDFRLAVIIIIIIIIVIKRNI